MKDSTLPHRLASRVVHDGRIVKLTVDTVRFPDGSEGDLEMIRHPGASAVLPVLGSLDEEDPEVVMGKLPDGGSYTTPPVRPAAAWLG